MNLVHNGLVHKVTSACRFLLVKIYFGKRFSVRKLSLIGPRNKIVMPGRGMISAKGRIVLSDHVMLYSKGELIIGDHFNMNSYSRIVAHQCIEVGDFVTIGQMVSILDHDHQRKWRNGNMELEGYVTDPIRIGHHVWIGDKCTILKGVHIGDNVVIAANSVVTSDIPSGVLAGGIPAKIIKSIGPRG